MRKIREILRLKLSAGLSPRQIAASIGAALSTIQECLRRAAQAGLSWPLPEGLDDAALEQRLYPPSSRPRPAPAPDFAHVQRELSRPGVTRMLLWQEYKAEHPAGLQYTAFCVQYQKWLQRTAEPVMRFEHQAGEKCFVDYAGQTVGIIDRRSGEITPVQIFVAVLGCSSYTYAEASLTQSLPDWLGSHVRALGYFGGVPSAFVPDNLKSGVQPERIARHLRAFCRWMVAQDWLVADPSKRIPNPRKPQQLPKAILDEAEVQRVLAQPDVHTPAGYRDRVILEVLYSSAIRRAEVAHVQLDDVDTAHGFLIVREGKNRKDRAVPIGAAVCALLESYIASVRADWPGADQDRHLFLNRFGQGMGPLAIWHVVRKYSRAAGVDRAVSTHTFRHSCATHMLRAGAPIRHLQEMLGARFHRDDPDLYAAHHYRPQSSP